MVLSSHLLNDLIITFDYEVWLGFCRWLTLMEQMDFAILNTECVLQNTYTYYNNYLCSENQLTQLTLIVKLCEALSACLIKCQKMYPYTSLILSFTINCDKKHMQKGNVKKMLTFLLTFIKTKLSFLACVCK